MSNAQDADVAAYERLLHGAELLQSMAKKAQKRTVYGNAHRGVLFKSVLTILRRNRRRLEASLDSDKATMATTLRTTLQAQRSIEAMLKPLTPPDPVPLPRLPALTVPQRVTSKADDGTIVEFASKNECAKHFDVHNSVLRAATVDDWIEIKAGVMVKLLA